MTAFRPAAVAALALLAACGPDPAGGGGPCEPLCQRLVVDCGVEAYPSLESCQQGCAYDAAQGAQTAAQLECVNAAACDPFEVLECEHRFGSPE